MADKIAMGFHTCVDYELEWDVRILENLIETYHICADELSMNIPIDTERALLIVCLAHMKEGCGGELVPEDPKVCTDFADHFRYEITIGGTAARAAIAIRKIGYECAIQMCCFNRHIRTHIPKGIHYYSSVGEETPVIYPHVVLSYQANAHIKGSDIDIITPRENRVMFSRDIDSMNMLVSLDFAPMIRDAEVFLLSCFSEVLDFDILKDRMAQTRDLLQTLPEKAVIIMEDGCYIRKDFKYYVLQELKTILDVLSMNEDELMEHADRRINILDPREVLAAVDEVHKKTGIPTIVVHTGKWAMAYGAKADIMKNALAGGIAMASVRFWQGDDFGAGEYEIIKEIPDRIESIEFSRQAAGISKERICCVPCKNLDFVDHPTVVGLGDFFAGGMLPELTADRRKMDTQQK